MLRLRGCIVSGILSSSFTSPTSSLHRLLSAAATATFHRISPNPSFAVEDYLVDTCGLIRPQALKASAKLSHLKSPSKPDAVLAFLAGIGLSSADVASLVAKDPRFLCASVERTLSPIVDDLADLGLSRSEIARLISLASGSCHFRCRSIVSKLHYYLPLFGSSENFFRVLKQGYYLLGADLERAVKPNVALLHECGLDNCAITKLCFTVSAMLSETPEHVQAVVASAEGIGVPRGSGMFREALNAVAFQSEEQIAAKVEFLKSTFKWSHAEVGIAVSKAPSLLRRSKDMLQRRSEFFISEVGLEPAYIAHRPIMITYSLEGRLRPRYYVVNFLIENGLLKHAVALNTIFNLVEKVFMDRYICPHKEAAPHLAEDYATTCKAGICDMRIEINLGELCASTSTGLIWRVGRWSSLNIWRDPWLLKSLTEESEGLKAQKTTVTDKASDMQETLDSGEEEKRSRRSMQVKLVRLEGDLSASEASHVHEAELKNKLGRIRRSNSEYQMKIQSLE